MKRVSFRNAVTLAFIGASVASTATAQSANGSQNSTTFTISDVAGAGDIRVLCAFRGLSDGQVSYVQSLPAFPSILEAAVVACPDTALELTNFDTASVGGGYVSDNDNPIFMGGPRKEPVRPTRIALETPPSAPPVGDDEGEGGNGDGGGSAGEGGDGGGTGDGGGSTGEGDGGSNTGGDGGGNTGGDGGGTGDGGGSAGEGGDGGGTGDGGATKGDGPGDGN